MNNLGILARQAGEHARARSLYLESLAIRRDLVDTWATAAVLSNLGNLEQARARCEEALALQREVGDKYYIANVLNNLGNVLRAQGEYPKAFQAYRESLLINQALGDGWSLAFLLEDVGLLDVLRGQPERALRLISAASALRERINAPLSPVERARLEDYLRPVHQALSEETQSALWAEGRQLNLSQAIELALEVE